MNLHFACSPSRIHIDVLRECEAKNLLFSFAFIKNPKNLIALLGEYKPKRIILDSGAFSVWSNGGSVDIDDYANFSTEFQSMLPPETKLFIVNLDVLPGKWGFVPTKQEIADSAKKGWENMLYLEKKGLKVIHVFHQHEDFQILEDLRAHSDYIGISPANDVSMKEKIAWLNKVFGTIRGTIRTHGFAVTSHKQVFGYPFYSVDSSSWVAPARFGRIAVMNGRHEIKTFPYKSAADVEKYWHYIASTGIEKIAHPSWKDRVSIAIKTYQKLEEEATKLWDSRGVHFQD